MVELTSEQFERTRKLALRLAGIELHDRHRELLGRRSQRLGIQDAAGIEALLQAAEDADPGASRQLVGLLTTSFTGFFRHPRHFDLAAQHALSAAEDRGRARLWSAGAATGEEPYSLAMALIETFRRDDPPATVLATDIDEAGLAAAQRGEYDERALRSLDADRRRRFFTEAEAGGLWRVAPAVRGLLEFRALNLAQVDWPADGPFDVIFCRNVLMYLETCYRYTVLERMASLLAQNGLLILDPAEHLGRAGHLFTAAGGGTYSPRRASRGPGGATGKPRAPQLGS